MRLPIQTSVPPLSEDVPRSFRLVKENCRLLFFMVKPDERLQKLFKAANYLTLELECL